MSPVSMVIAAIVLLMFSVLVVIIVFMINREREEAPDWADKIHRPCCRYCAYWFEGTPDGDRKYGFCEKRRAYQVWDGCCMNYDGIDTEVQDDYFDQDPV